MRSHSTTTTSSRRPTRIRTALDCAPASLQPCPVSTVYTHVEVGDVVCHTVVGCGVSHRCTKVWAQARHTVQLCRPYSRPWFSARCEHRVYRNHTWFSFQTPGPASHMAGVRMASTQLTAQLGVDGRSRPAWGLGRDRGQACVLLLTVVVKAGCWCCAARGKWR